MQKLFLKLKGTSSLALEVVNKEQGGWGANSALLL
jgi:hypothetical protein